MNASVMKNVHANVTTLITFDRLTNGDYGSLVKPSGNMNFSSRCRFSSQPLRDFKRTWTRIVRHTTVDYCDVWPSVVISDLLKRYTYLCLYQTINIHTTSLYCTLLCIYRISFDFSRGIAFGPIIRLARSPTSIGWRSTIVVVSVRRCLMCRSVTQTSCDSCRPTVVFHKCTNEKRTASVGTDDRSARTTHQVRRARFFGSVNLYVFVSAQSVYYNVGRVVHYIFHMPRASNRSGTGYPLSNVTERRPRWMQCPISHICWWSRIRVDDFHRGGFSNFP